MNRLLILHNEELTSEAFKYQYESYKKAFENIGVKADICPTSAYLSALFDSGENINADAVIFLDKDVIAASILESKGINVFNSAECIRICDDKALTYLTLYNKGIQIPKTVIAPKTYAKSQTGKWCKNAGKLIGYPLVIKECFGSLGKQVYLAKNEKEMLETVEKIGTRPFVIQEYLEKGAGWDLRVITAGGEVIGAIKRTSTTDFRANAALGGKAESITLCDSEKKLALEASEACGAFFAGVDLILGDDGYKVCEVNSNMLFEAADKALGISVAGEIAQKVKNCCLIK